MYYENTDYDNATIFSKDKGDFSGADTFSHFSWGITPLAAMSATLSNDKTGAVGDPVLSTDQFTFVREKWYYVMC